jgi:hypothetical protein
MTSSPATTILENIGNLADEHSDLDIAISVLLDTGSCDDLLIRRLKKRKLQIKDEIARLSPRQEMISCVA